jgi:hypothetical protein
VKRKVGHLAYELELPPQWQIHPVISVAHLHPEPTEADPFNRPREDGQEPVDTEGDTEEWISCELDRIVTHKYYQKTKRLEYLVKYKGLSNAYNEWFPEELLGNTQDLLRVYKTQKHVEPSPLAKTKRVLSFLHLAK